MAVLRAAESSGAEKVTVRVGDVYSIGVYLEEGEFKTLAYIDWDRGWGWRMIFNHLIGLTKAQPQTNRDHGSAFDMVIEDA
jgi:hypothetical protein